MTKGLWIYVPEALDFLEVTEEGIAIEDLILMVSFGVGVTHYFTSGKDGFELIYLIISGYILHKIFV